MPQERVKVDAAASQLAPVASVVPRAQRLLHAMLRDVADLGGITRDHYIRYLSFQYHLTRGVQRAFLAVAAHETLSDRPPLREFLFKCALEEEPHYGIAERDLERLGAAPLECPLDVKLWWSYLEAFPFPTFPFFTGLIPTRPFVRLGATCVLDSLGAGSGDVARGLLAGASFITPENSRFIQIHFHEAPPHVDRIHDALASVPLTSDEVCDLRQGAIEGSAMYLRMASWALRADRIPAEFDQNVELGV